MTVDTQALRAIAVRETAGFVKWNVDPQPDRVLGAAAVGTHATELIAKATFGEAWMETDHAFAGEYIHAPPREKRS
jgi:pyruvate/2-oxoglutarate dehydrogenase complex dihydrolipoamide dehydrogenase (E3) component